MNSRIGSLASIKVIDASRVLGGPYAGQILGDHGADVVKIEPPAGDETRGWGPPFLGATASYFVGVNRNKEGMTLDLSQPAGQELLRRPDAPRLWVVLDETVLRRPVGGSAVMRAQIDRLVEAAALPHITIQIVPFSAGPHPGMFGPFQLFRFRYPELPDIVYAEALTGAAYLDERDDVVAYLEALDRMGTQAVPASRTESLLAALRKEI